MHGNNSIKKGDDIRNFFKKKEEQQKIERNTIKTNWHKLLTAISDGNHNFQ